jgi:hypothetical protein
MKEGVMKMFLSSLYGRRNDSPPPDPPKKKMRTVTVDEKRRAEVISRHARWRGIKDHEHHLAAVKGGMILTDMGMMTRDAQISSGAFAAKWIREEVGN